MQLIDFSHAVESVLLHHTTGVIAPYIGSFVNSSVLFLSRIWHLWRKFGLGKFGSSQNIQQNMQNYVKICTKNMQIYAKIWTQYAKICIFCIFCIMIFCICRSPYFTYFAYTSTTHFADGARFPRMVERPRLGGAGRGSSWLTSTAVTSPERRVRIIIESRDDMPRLPCHMAHVPAHKTQITTPRRRHFRRSESAAIIAGPDSPRPSREGGYLLTN